MFACKIKTDTGERNSISLNNGVKMVCFPPRFSREEGGGRREVSGQFRTICLSCFSLNYLLSLSIGPREAGPSEGGSS